VVFNSPQFLVFFSRALVLHARPSAWRTHKINLLIASIWDILLKRIGAPGLVFSGDPELRDFKPPGHTRRTLTRAGNSHCRRPRCSGCSSNRPPGPRGAQVDKLSAVKYAVNKTGGRVCIPGGEWAKPAAAPCFPAPGACLHESSDVRLIPGVFVQSRVEGRWCSSGCRSAWHRRPRRRRPAIRLLNHMRGSVVMYGAAAVR
jgi:hypothetical protein